MDQVYPNLHNRHPHQSDVYNYIYLYKQNQVKNDQPTNRMTPFYQSDKQFWYMKQDQLQYQHQPNLLMNIRPKSQFLQLIYRKPNSNLLY